MKANLNNPREAASELILTYGLKDSQAVALRHIVTEQDTAGVANHWVEILRRLNLIEADAYCIEIVETPTGTFRLLDRRPLGKGFGFAVRLPSGMTHSFDTEEDARASQVWPMRVDLG